MWILIENQIKDNHLLEKIIGLEGVKKAYFDKDSKGNLGIKVEGKAKRKEVQGIVNSYLAGNIEKAYQGEQMSTANIQPILQELNASFTNLINSLEPTIKQECKKDIANINTLIKDLSNKTNGQEARIVGLEKTTQGLNTTVEELEQRQAKLDTIITALKEVMAKG